MVNDSIRGAGCWAALALAEQLPVDRLILIGFDAPDTPRRELARLRAFVRRREEDVGTAGTGGDYHAFAQSELHLTRSKVCHKDDKTPDELLGLRIRRFNPRENLTRFRSAKRNLEFQQFPRFFNLLRFNNTADAKVDFHEVVDRNRFAQRLVNERLRRIVPLARGSGFGVFRR